MIEQYRKKPVVIDCMKLSFQSLKEIGNFIEGVETKLNNDGVIIKTLEGNMLAQWGDYIIKGVLGQFYPCKPDIFHQTYEKV